MLAFIGRVRAPQDATLQPRMSIHDALERTVASYVVQPDVQHVQLHITRGVVVPVVKGERLYLKHHLLLLLARARAHTHQSRVRDKGASDEYARTLKHVDGCIAGGFGM